MTDLVRWSDPASLSADWADRARFAARFIPQGLRILDVGCGAMDLERFVAAADYVPADIVARDRRTQIVDLNRTPLAPHLLRDADLVTMLGVLEYLDDVDVHLAAIGRAGRPLLFSYCATDRHPSKARRDSGWVNDFSTEDLLAKLAAHRFDVAQSTVFGTEQVVMLAAPTGAWPDWLTARLTVTQAAPRQAGRRRSLVLAGFYGRGNCGDEAILQCVREAFAADYDIIVSVDEHGAYPGFWDWYPYRQARIIHQTNLSELFNNPALAGIIVGGGGLPLGFAANQVIAARSAGKKAAFVGTDLWPGRPSTASDVARAVSHYLDLFDFVAVRHARSLDCPGARTFGRVVHGADWALRLPTDEAADISLDRRRALVTLREFAIETVPHVYGTAVAAMIQAVRDGGFSPLMLPFCPEDQRFLAELGLDRLAPIESCWWNPRRAKQWIAASGLLLSVGRLHPLVFAASTGTPAASVVPPLLIENRTGFLTKLADMTAELGIATVEGVAGVAGFAAAPMPAQPAKVMASNARLEAMIGRLRELFAD